MLLPVSLFTAWLFQPLAPVFAIGELIRSGAVRSDELWGLFMIRGEFYYVFIYVGFILVCTALVSYAYVAIYRHFRTGKFSIRTPIAYVNSAFLPALKVLLTMAAYLFVYRALSIGILAIVAKAVVAWGIPFALFVIFAVLLLSAGTALGFYLVGTPLLMISQMFVYGYSFVEGWSASAKLVTGKNKARIFATVSAPAVAMTVVDLILLLCGAAEWVVILVLTVLLIVVFAYYITLSLTLMFDLTGMERRDLNNQRYSS